MNEIVNKFLLAENKFIPEMHLKQPTAPGKSGFTYSACGPFTKSKIRIQKFKETGDRKYIYRNELDKACFQHDMTYGDFKDLARRTASDKVLKDKAFNIAKNPKHDGYQRGLASMVYKFFYKKWVVVLLHLQINLLLIMKLNKMNNQLKNCTSRLLKFFKKEQLILHSEKIFGVLI